MGMPPLVRATRNETRSGAIPAGVWSGLLVGLGVLVSGVLYLRYPRYPRGTWLGWIPITLITAGLMFVIVPWVLSRSRARHLGSSSADTPGLSSAPMPGPGPAITLDASSMGLIEWIKNVRFSTTRIAPGYDEEEVDAFLDKLVAVLGEIRAIVRSGSGWVWWCTGARRVWSR
jgi:DivIVA domain-containing protein